MSFWKWSRTAASNANADGSINWAEGQSPSSVNDSARAMMAAAAKFRDDIQGAITTGGSSTAYTVSSFQGFDTLAHMDGALIAFTPHATNTGTSTLNVDGLSAKPLRAAPGVEIASGTLVLGTPYMARYNNASGEWLLVGFYGSDPTSYAVPIGATLDYFGSTAPNSSFVLPYGQALSRTTYATRVARLGLTFGTGDGSTTFNIPDLRGRIAVGKDDMGGVAATRITSAGSSIDGTALGATGGEQAHTLTTPEMPSHNHGVTDPGHTHVYQQVGASSINLGGVNQVAVPSGPTANTSSSTTGITINNTGGGGAHNNMQPSMVVTKILRVL